MTQKLSVFKTYASEFITAVSFNNTAIIGYNDLNTDILIYLNKAFVMLS